MTEEVGDEKAEVSDEIDAYEGRGLDHMAFSNRLADLSVPKEQIHEFNQVILAGEIRKVARRSHGEQRLWLLVLANALDNLKAEVKLAISPGKAGRPIYYGIRVFNYFRNKHISETVWDEYSQWGKMESAVAHAAKSFRITRATFYRALTRHADRLAAEHKSVDALLDEPGLRAYEPPVLSEEEEQKAEAYHQFASWLDRYSTDSIELSE